MVALRLSLFDTCLQQVFVVIYRSKQLTKLALTDVEARTACSKDVDITDPSD